MRYGPIPEGRREEGFLSSPRVPLPLYDSLLALVQSSSLIAGVRLGIFEALAERPMTSPELAMKLGLDDGMLELLLRVLQSNAYVTLEHDSKVALGDVARQTLIESSDGDLTAWVTFMGHMWNVFPSLPDVVKTGRGLDFHTTISDEAWGPYQTAMLENARRVAPFLAAMVPVRSGALRLLDVGGSHGLFSAHIARAHPPMRSEILELPSAVAHASRLAEGEGITDVVTFRRGDALQDDFGTNQDVVLMSNFLHGFRPDDIATLLGKALHALGPNGTLAIWDVCRSNSGDPAELVGDAYALFFGLTSGARCYTVDEFMGWVSEAGFVDVSVKRLPLGRSTVLIIGRSPCE